MVTSACVVRTSNSLAPLASIVTALVFRVRLGIEGKLNEDFTGGLAFRDRLAWRSHHHQRNALTNFFERKTIGL